MLRLASAVGALVLSATSAVAQDRTAEIERGMIVVRFVRNDAGKVVGFDYSDPLVRNIRFKRLPDSTAPAELPTPIR